MTTKIRWNIGRVIWEGFTETTNNLTSKSPYYD
jgi:hypothetical protein